MSNKTSDLELLAVLFFPGLLGLYFLKAVLIVAVFIFGKIPLFIFRSLRDR